MREFFRFLSDFGDSFFRGFSGRLALATLGTAFGLTLVAVSLKLSDDQVRDTFGWVQILIVLTTIFLVLRPARDRQ